MFGNINNKSLNARLFCTCQTNVYTYLKNILMYYVTHICLIIGGYFMYNLLSVFILLTQYKSINNSIIRLVFYNNSIYIAYSLHSKLLGQHTLQ